MLRLNEETGEWYEDEYDQKEVSEDFPLAEEPPGEHVPLLKGYGTRVVMDKTPGEWITEWGAPASPEYVQDIDQPIAPENASINTEADLSRKISEQRIQNKPSGDQMAIFDRLNNAMDFMEPDIRKNAEKFADDMLYKSSGYAVGLPKLPNEQKAWAQWYAQAYENHQNTAKSFFEKQITIEQEQIRHERELKVKQIEDAQKRSEKLSDAAVRREERLADIAARQDISIDDRTKEYLRTLRTEQADVGKELRGIKAQLTKYGVANPDVIPSTLAKNELISGLVTQYNQLRDTDTAIESKVNEILLNKPSEAKGIIEKGGGAVKGHILSGMKAGRYRVGGNIVKWNGSVEIP